jgi:hypothetical protein
MAMRWRAVVGSIGAGLAAPACALAAGGPVPAVQGQGGIVAPGGSFRYVALGAGRDTILSRVALRGGRTVSIRLHGPYGIPGADLNGSTTGLSGDGRTLVLAQIGGPFPQRTTRLLVLDATRLRVRTRLVLPGWLTVDAISPNGRWLYLIHYFSADVSKYEVRAYDLPGHRLIARPIVDPRDRGEQMTGYPVSRVMSADGRWAYTLYGRPSGIPFIHALDTTERRAVCIDLPSLAHADIGGAALRLTDGGTLVRIESGGLRMAIVDTRTFAVDPVIAPRTPAAVVAPRDAGGSDGMSWALVAAAIAAVATLGAGIRRRLLRSA